MDVLIYINISYILHCNVLDRYLSCRIASLSTTIYIFLNTGAFSSMVNLAQERH